jgi:glycosyltransferase involved in cell wall biosynthesis
MKIIYLHQYFNTPDMSGGTRSFEMARRFVSEGHEVHIITSWREATRCNDWVETEVEGFRVHWLPVLYSNSMSFSARIRAFFKFAFCSARKAASLNADVVFATSTPLTIVIPAVYASKLQKIPMVFEVRDLWPELPISMGALNNPVARFLAKKLEIFAYEKSSSIVALSPGMKEGVVRTGFPSSKIAVIPNSSDVKTFRIGKEFGEIFRNEREWLGNDPLLIYTGTFGLINGVDYLIDLAIHLSNLKSDVKILAIGGGIKFDEVIEQATTAGVLNHNFFIEAYLKKKDIAAALSAATISSALFIDKPEMRPNSANKFFDSLAAGKPIMINYGGWMHELIESNGCGLSMWQKPIDQVAKELDECLHDRSWLEKTSEASAVLADRFFDRDILATQLLKVLQSTVEGCPDKAEKIGPGIYSE